MTAAPLALPAMPSRYRQTCPKTALKAGDDALVAVKRSRADVDRCNLLRAGAVKHYDTVAKEFGR